MTGPEITLPLPDLVVIRRPARGSNEMPLEYCTVPISGTRDV